MRSKDQVLLENLYTKIIKESAYLEKWNNYSEQEKEKIEKYYPWMVPNWTDNLIIPDAIKNYFPDMPGGILKNQVAKAFYDQTVKTENKCLYKVYKIFTLESKNYSSEPDWDEAYLKHIQGKYYLK